MAPTFPVTNECLEAIIAGIHPQDDDVVLAVGGSGDQAFALMEHAKKVLVIDNNPEQIGMIEKRKNALSHGDLDLFLERQQMHKNFDSLYLARDEYFNQPGRFEKLSENVDRLMVLPTMGLREFFSYEDHSEVTAVYSLNALGFGWGHVRDEEFRLLENIGRMLGPSSRIYMTNGDSVVSDRDRIKGFNDFAVNMDHFEVDVDRTAVARGIQMDSPLDSRYGWKPAVLNVK